MNKCIFYYLKIIQKYYYKRVVKILSVCYNISRGNYTLAELMFGKNIHHPQRVLTSPTPLSNKKGIRYSQN